MQCLASMSSGTLYTLNSEERNVPPLTVSMQAEIYDTFHVLFPITRSGFTCLRTCSSFSDVQKKNVRILFVHGQSTVEWSVNVSNLHHPLTACRLVH